MKQSTEGLPPHCVTRLSLRVRFGETDLMGIVHHASYLGYVEAGRVEYLRRRGADYRTLTETGFHMPVVEARLRYRKPARFDDLLVVEARLAAFTRVTVRFDYRVVRPKEAAGDEELLAEGHTLLACVDDGHVPRRIPAEVAGLLLAPEAEGVADTP